MKNSQKSIEELAEAMRLAAELARTMDALAVELGEQLPVGTPVTLLGLMQVISGNDLTLIQSLAAFISFISDPKVAQGYIPLSGLGGGGMSPNLRDSNPNDDRIARLIRNGMVALAGLGIAGGVAGALLGGILIAPSVNLDSGTLSLIIVNAYAADDYAKAQKLQLEGYQQMLGVANTLVDAIQRTVKPQLPVGGSQTGGGGTATRRR